METITKVNSEVDDNEIQISQDCLGVPTILRHVLQHISTKELIKHSLVSKLWNFEARSVMKERGTLIASISTKEDSTCQLLVAFGSALENMRVIPFSGIYVHLHHPRACQPISDESLGPSFEAILHRLPWTFFAVGVCDEWKLCKNCPAFQLVETILATFCGVFEEFSLHGGHEYCQSILKDRWLSRLKALRVKTGDLYATNEPLTSAFIEGLVLRAPNLQDLDVGGAINFKLNVLQGSTAILVPTHALRPLFEQVCEDLISSLRVNAVEIRIENEEMSPELLNWFVPMVLASSGTTLKSLFLLGPIMAEKEFFRPWKCRPWPGLNFLVLLSHYGIHLENVTTVVILLNGEMIFDNVDAAISELQLPRSVPWMFPKINQSAIFHHQGRSYLWLYQAHPSSGQGGPIPYKITWHSLH